MGMSPKAMRWLRPILTVLAVMMTLYGGFLFGIDMYLLLDGPHHNGIGTDVPLTVITGVTMLGGVWLLVRLWVPVIRQARGTRASRRASCGHDRAGLAQGAACPECGKG